MMEIPGDSCEKRNTRIPLRCHQAWGGCQQDCVATRVSSCFFLIFLFHLLPPERGRAAGDDVFCEGETVLSLILSR